jgi:hypothetical protein
MSLKYEQVLFRTAWIYYIVRFQILMAASMKMTTFLFIAPSSLIDVDRHCRGAYCLHCPDDGGS